MDEQIQLFQRMVEALEEIAAELQEQNRIAREDLELIREVDLNDFEFEGKPN